MYTKPFTFTPAAIPDPKYDDTARVIVDAVKAREKHVSITLPPGAGKTVTSLACAANLCGEIEQRIVFAAPDHEQKSKAHVEFKQVALKNDWYIPIFLETPDREQECNDLFKLQRVPQVLRRFHCKECEKDCDYKRKMQEIVDTKLSVISTHAMLANLELDNVLLFIDENIDRDVLRTWEYPIQSFTNAVHACENAAFELHHVLQPFIQSAFINGDVGVTTLTNDEIDDCLELLHDAYKRHDRGAMDITRVMDCIVHVNNAIKNNHEWRFSFGDNIIIKTRNDRLMKSIGEARKIVYLDATGSAAEIAALSGETVKTNEHELECDNVFQCTNRTGAITELDNPIVDIEYKETIDYIIEHNRGKKILIIARRKCQPDIPGALIIRNAKRDRKKEMIAQHDIVIDYYPLKSVNDYKHFDIVILHGAPFLSKPEIAFTARAMGLDFKIVESRQAAEMIQSAWRIRPEKGDGKTMYILSNLTLPRVKITGWFKMPYAGETEEKPDLRRKKLLARLYRSDRVRDDSIDDRETLRELECESLIQKVRDGSKYYWEYIGD
jgi:hypothetical protein